MKHVLDRNVGGAKAEFKHQLYSGNVEFKDLSRLKQLKHDQGLREGVPRDNDRIAELGKS